MVGGLDLCKWPLKRSQRFKRKQKKYLADFEEVSYGHNKVYCERARWVGLGDGLWELRATPGQQLKESRDLGPTTCGRTGNSVLQPQI